jgi:glycosyltransferase involved in cell wall biosynthesis
MTPLRILHCVRAPIGGIFRHVQDLAREQARQGHQVGVVCDASSGGAFEQDMIATLSQDLPLGVTRLPMRREPSLADLASVHSVLRLVGDLAPDVLHGHGAKGGAYARLIATSLSRRGRRIGAFYAPHGGSLHYARDSRAGRFYFAVERGLERLTSGLVFVSAYERDAYIDRVGRPRVPYVMVRNGLRPDEFEPVVLRPDAVDFLFIGMLRDLKGGDVFLNAIDLVEQRHGRRPTALMIGDGPDRDAYHALALRLGLGDRLRIEMPAPAREAFARAHAVVVPSRAESSPYIVLETIAAGIPLIATRVGGIPEILANEVHALVPPGDADALADAMAAMLHDPEGTLEAAAARREWFRRRHTLAGMAERITAFYREAEPSLDQAPLARRSGAAGG